MESPLRLFIVGCGRNGTSLAAGLFRASAGFDGQRLHPPSPENPTGYFEDAAINKLNNRIINRQLPATQTHDGIIYGADSPIDHGWLARLPLSVTPDATPDEKDLIAARVGAGRPFVIKDTRLTYLLHLWRAPAPDARMICVFRRPEQAAASILKSCRTRPGLAQVAISVAQAFEIWTLMYRHVLERHATTGDWLFVFYDDLIAGDGADRIETFAQAPIDRSIIDAGLNRSPADLSPPEDALAVFAELMARAGS